LSERWATFDCYGTLIDWERGIADTFTRLWPDRDAEALVSRYHEVEPQVQRDSNVPYREVLDECLRRIASSEGLAIAETETDALARSLPEWPPFADVPPALHELRERGWRLGVLSNTDPELLTASVGCIGVPVDVRITVAEAGSYKPAPGHWERFFADTGADRSHHVHVAASVFHDLEPAHALALRSVWINRLDERSEVPRSAELPDLSGLPDVLDTLVHPQDYG
jgi:2-haloacid dehalogenase